MAGPDPGFVRRLCTAATPSRRFRLGEEGGSSDGAELARRKRRWRQAYRARNRGQRVLHAVLEVTVVTVCLGISVGFTLVAVLWLWRRIAGP